MAKRGRPRKQQPTEDAPRMNKPADGPIVDYPQLACPACGAKGQRPDGRQAIVTDATRRISTVTQRSHRCRICGRMWKSQESAAPDLKTR